MAVTAVEWVEGLFWQGRARARRVQRGGGVRLMRWAPPRCTGPVRLRLYSAQVLHLEGGVAGPRGGGGGDVFGRWPGGRSWGWSWKFFPTPGRSAPPQPPLRRDGGAGVGSELHPARGTVRDEGAGYLVPFGKEAVVLSVCDGIAVGSSRGAAGDVGRVDGIGGVEYTQCMAWSRGDAEFINPLHKIGGLE